MGLQATKTLYWFVKDLQVFMLLFARFVTTLCFVMWKNEVLAGECFIAAGLRIAVSNGFVSIEKYCRVTVSSR